MKFMFNSSNYLLDENENLFLNMLENSFKIVFPDRELYIFQQNKEIYFKLSENGINIGFLKLRNKTKLRYEYEAINPNWMPFMIDTIKNKGKITGKEYLDFLESKIVLVKDITLEEMLKHIPSIVEGAHNKYINGIYDAKALKLDKFINSITGEVENVPF